MRVPLVEVAITGCATQAINGQYKMGRQAMSDSANANYSKQHFVSPDNSPSEEVESTILDAVRSIRYGSVEIIIHDSRVVQIESKKKLRMKIGPKS
jgi:hypothetical protein